MWLLLNYTYASGINGVSITKDTGCTEDIIPLLRFCIWQPVYYKVDESDFLLDSTEKCGFWVGIAEHVGHDMNFKVLSDDTHKVIFRYNFFSS